MVDVFSVADVFVSHAVRVHGHEVGIIAYYGSYATGAAGPTSDLDLIFIPDEGKAGSLAACFVLDGICFDFFPIGWERAERLANGTDGWAVGPALIAEARVLYARSEEDRARFEKLRARTAELRRPENRAYMVGRALEALKVAIFHLGNLRLAMGRQDAESGRCAAWRVATGAVECLALANQVSFSRGWDANLGEMSRLALRPADLEDLILTVATSAESEAVAGAAEALVSRTRELLLQDQGAGGCRERVPESFANSYPEIRDKVLKIVARCESGQTVGASWAAAAVQEEVARAMEQGFGGSRFSDLHLYAEYAGAYRSEGLPALTEALARGGPQGLHEEAGRFDEGIRRWLAAHSVGLNTLGSLEDLQRFLEKRDPGPRDDAR